MLEIPFGSANLVFLRLWLRFTVSGIKKVVGDGDVIEVDGTLDYKSLNSSLTPIEEVEKK